MEQEEQFASRKNIQKSSNFLIQGKNKKYIQGPRGGPGWQPEPRIVQWLWRITTAIPQGEVGRWRITTAIRQRGFGQQHADCNCSQSIGPIKELSEAKR
jgi:hypothetical protein